MQRFLLKVHYVLTVPIAIYFILGSQKIHPSYKMTWWRKTRLGWKMFRNKLSVQTGTSYKAHLAMALKLLETPPEETGDVVECGTWKGGSAVNLSLVCKITGRKLRIFDSFEGLPPGEEGDREAVNYEAGEYMGTLPEVKSNLTKYGAIECCEFVQGWFKDTLPHIDFPIALAFFDVDLEASLSTCVEYVWPHLIDRGYIFTDECVHTNYVALFYSEKWWKQKFDRTPPGLIGAGTGLPLGEYYIGPWEDIESHPGQHASTGAYTRKDMSGFWDFYPEEASSEA